MDCRALLGTSAKGASTVSPMRRDRPQHPALSGRMLRPTGTAAYRVLDSHNRVTSDAYGVRPTPACKHPLHPHDERRWLRLTCSSACHLDGLRFKSIRWTGICPTGLNSDEHKVSTRDGRRMRNASPRAGRCGERRLIAPERGAREPAGRGGRDGCWARWQRCNGPEDPHVVGMQRASVPRRGGGTPHARPLASPARRQLERLTPCQLRRQLASPPPSAARPQLPERAIKMCTQNV